MIQGVIFDMDGLMLDTEPIWTRSWEPALAKLGIPYKEGLAEAMRGTSGASAREVLHRFYGEAYDIDKVEDALYREAQQAFEKPVPKKPGLDELLAWLNAQGIPAAVASSSREASIRHHLDNWGLVPHFAAIVSGDHVSHSKPDPEIFLLAAQKLGTPPAHTLVLEDSFNGVRAGVAGGFVTVMVPDLDPADDEMRSLYTAECKDLHEVLALLQAGKL